MLKNIDFSYLLKVFKDETDSEKSPENTANLEIVNDLSQILKNEEKEAITPR